MFGVILPRQMILLCQVVDLIQHILDEDAVACGGIVDENVGDGADKLAVLDDGRARHECVQVGTTHFYKLLIVSTLFIKKNVVSHRCLHIFCVSRRWHGLFSVAF